MKSMTVLALYGLMTLGQAQDALAVHYFPYGGGEGYQEIRVEEDTFYVAIHGSNATSVEELSVAWNVRAAQLCKQVGASRFVKLRYSFEPIFEGESMQSRLKLSGVEWSQNLRQTGGSTYIPIYIPQYHGPIELSAPSSMAHVRCVNQVERMVAPDRLQDVDAALAKGVELKYIGKR